MEVKPDMKITLNGSAYKTEGPVTISGLLESLGFSGKPVVVEVNEEAVFPRDHGQVRLADGDRVEVVALAAGG